MSLNVKLNINGAEFWASAQQAATIETLMETNKGGFACVKGYVSKSAEKANHTVLTRLNLERLYKRRIDALNKLKFDDALAVLLKNPETSKKLTSLTLTELEATFNDRRKKLVESLESTLNGVREDARRQSHDRNYCTVADGVKVHFLTEKGEDGLKHPVLKDGLPQVESIMLMHVSIKKDVITEGEYKKVNSGVPVLMGNAIESLLPKSTQIRTFSLKEDNFDSIVIDHQTILPKDIAGDFT